jgi:hypothetical protein
MQKFSEIDASRLKSEVVYQGVTFTLTRLTYQNENHIIVAEGLSRRSPVDAPDDELAREISMGRARKALSLKLKHEPIRSHFMG